MTIQRRLNVSTTAANMPLTSDLIDSAKSATPHKAVAGNAELEELAVLFRDYHKTIFRIAYRITGSQSDAEDVLQTIFLRLTPNHARRDFLPNAGAYLHRAAVNASLDLLRSRTRANSVSLDYLAYSLLPDVKDFNKNTCHNFSRCGVLRVDKSPC